jgi:hypothetical protein
MLMESLSRGQTPMEAMYSLFSISMHDLANRAGQIGTNRERVHAWLRDNNLALIETVEIGSNLSGLVTKARLTDLVELRWIGHEPAADQCDLDTQTQIALLAQSGDVSQAVFEHLYPELVGKDLGILDQSKFDIIDVDVKSLVNYLHWLQKGSKRFNADQINQYQYQARLILAVATHTLANTRSASNPVSLAEPTMQAPASKMSTSNCAVPFWATAGNMTSAPA